MKPNKKTTKLYLALTIFVLSIALVLLFNNNGPAEENADYMPNELLVNFNPGVSTTTINSINTQIGTVIISKIEYISNHYVYRLKIISSLSVSDAIQQYQLLQEVERASPNTILRLY